MKKLIYILAFILYPAFLVAQDSEPLYQVDNQSITIENSNLLVNFNLLIPPTTHLSPNEGLIITPVLHADSSQQGNMALPNIWVSGRSRNIINERSHKYRNNTYEAIRRKNNTEQVVNYTVRIPYESWMNDGYINLVSQLLGCANCKKNENDLFLANIRSQEYIIQPFVAFVVPPKEIKTRDLKGSAYLDFPVNQIVIHPDYMSNRQELQKINNSIDIVKNDKNSSITDIQIVGFASPEGSYQNNAYLAQQRAEALKTYLLQQYQLNGNLIKVSSVPEDWEGLKTWVTMHEIDYKSQILDIINSDAEPDAKNWKIKILDNGIPYQYLLTNVYPSLRHSDYTINYVVRDFSPEEAMHIFKQSPNQLSLQELYIVAHQYPIGSDQFKEVFDIAVRMYPVDEIANANAAGIEILNGNTHQATKFINKADSSNPAVINNKGLIELLQGNYDAAKSLFIEAQSKGSVEASSNLRELDRKHKSLKFNQKE